MIVLSVEKKHNYLKVIVQENAESSVHPLVYSSSLHPTFAIAVMRNYFMH